MRFRGTRLGWASSMGSLGNRLVLKLTGATLQGGGEICLKLANTDGEGRGETDTRLANTAVMLR